MRFLWFFLLPWTLLAGSWQAAAASFDLAGPKIDVRVKRGSVTLPIAAVPNLQSGDRLWIHPDLPQSQSEHFVLVVAFLRGVTNPPPADWFTRVETWAPAIRSEGIHVLVPAEAQQALLFLVPETGGDFNTLKKAVRDQPGSFVRAVQDLQLASWDRSRVESYLAQVKVTSQSDQKTLKERAEMASRSLGIKLQQECFDKPAEQQAGCLAQNPDGLVLDDSNVQSLVAQLTSGSTAELMNDISSTRMAGSGAYSAYVGAVVDTAKIMASLHTAHFRYTPALALPSADTLNLRLATPPSFRNPKTVVLIALPPIGDAKLPPLHPVNAADSFCVVRPGLVLPVEGAPLVFATAMGHDLQLHLEPHGQDASGIDLPVTTDPSKGGLVLGRALADQQLETLSGEISAEVRGKWGFDSWAGPRFHLRVAGTAGWTVAAADQSALVVGRDDTLHLEGDNTLCVDRIEAQAADGAAMKIAWRSPRPEQLELTVPLKDAPAGPVRFSIYQFGQSKPLAVVAKAYADAASLDGLVLNAGDPDAHLKGTRLDEVAAVALDGLNFAPAGLNRLGDSDQLTVKTGENTTRFQPGSKLRATVTLNDGRVLHTPATIEPPRPQVTLASRGMQPSGASAVELGSGNDLPLDGRLVFFLKAAGAANFPRDAKVEVAAVDGGFRTVLSLADASLMLEDARTVMGSLEPLTRFGASAFGPVQVRVLAANGTAGDWLPLGTLVRLPGFKELRCPRSASRPCTLAGNNLFLATAFSATRDFANPAEVPPEFTGTQLAVPHPANGVLYVHLRDDPDAVATLTLPVQPAANDAKVQDAKPPADKPDVTAPIAPAVPPPAPQQPATAPNPPTHPAPAAPQP